MTRDVTKHNQGKEAIHIQNQIFETIAECIYLIRTWNGTANIRSCLCEKYCLLIIVFFRERYYIPDGYKNHGFLKA